MDEMDGPDVAEYGESDGDEADIQKAE